MISIIKENDLSPYTYFSFYDYFKEQIFACVFEKLL